VEVNLQKLYSGSLESSVTSWSSKSLPSPTGLKLTQAISDVQNLGQVLSI